MHWLSAASVWFIGKFQFGKANHHDEIIRTTAPANVPVQQHPDSQERARTRQAAKSGLIVIRAAR
jgi:hypothetical protein